MKLDTSKVLSKEKREQLDAVLGPLILTDEFLERIRVSFSEQMDLANSTDENVRKTSSHLMMNSFIRELLDGTEQGDYLGLDLGGTNFRVVLVRFKDGVADTVTTYYTLREEVLCGPSAGVFDFIAESIKDFLETNGLSDSKTRLPLGFTFSFPQTQLALNKSILLTWTKSFRCPDGVGEDPVKMLEEAIERKAKGIPVDVVVVMSDTVSTLMAGNYLDKKCCIGLILGTGCNAAFVENIEDIAKWTGDFQDPKHVIVNVELGSTGDNGCMDFARSEYEKEVDKYSNHPGSFTFEKSFSGMYLGELVRLVLVRLIKNGTLFEGKAENLVNQRWQFTTSDVTSIESDESDNTSNTKNVLARFRLSSASDEDVAIVREVCEFISRRGAHIIAAGWTRSRETNKTLEEDVKDLFGVKERLTVGIYRSHYKKFICIADPKGCPAMSVLVNHSKLKEVVIGLDGSLYEKHPKFHDSMMEMFDKFSPQTKVKMILAKDGSGQGAAFAAVSALKQTAKEMRCS